jgi:hypothetical protein
MLVEKRGLGEQPLQILPYCLAPAWAGVGVQRRAAIFAKRVE